MQKKALIILCVLVLTSSGYAAPPAHAAIPVIDVDNITQQLKTYQETVKVVTNTKEQVELQWKELKKRKRKINQCIEKAPDLCYPFFISLRL